MTSISVLECPYHRYEAGDLEPNHETTIKLSDYFDVTIDYLLGRVNYYELNEKSDNK